MYHHLVPSLSMIGLLLLISTKPSDELLEEKGGFAGFTVSPGLGQSLARKAGSSTIMMVG